MGEKERADLENPGRRVVTVWECELRNQAELTRRLPLLSRAYRRHRQTPLILETATGCDAGNLCNLLMLIAILPTIPSLLQCRMASLDREEDDTTRP